MAPARRSVGGDRTRTAGKPELVHEMPEGTALTPGKPARHPLGSYLVLLDYTGQLCRDGKPVISNELTRILNRLGSSVESWRARLEKFSYWPSVAGGTSDHIFGYDGCLRVLGAENPHRRTGGAASRARQRRQNERPEPEV